ncbi:MAG: diguanylate cyclase domain-containing protein [Bacillota bacterium]
MEKQSSLEQACPQENIYNLLAGMPLFMELPDNPLRKLSKLMKSNWYKKDTVIFREGENGDQVFVIAKGSVKIFKNKDCIEETILSTVGYGDIFGEMSILDSFPRSADVTAMEDTLLFSLNRDDFLSFLKKNPEATLKLLTLMSMKLRNTNELVVKHREIQEQLRYIGHHDSLTGLYNRAFLQSELTRLEAGPFYQTGLIICDVDGLKLVNDTMGHEAGDELLVAAARVIKRSFRDEDVVARVGGDEFAVLLLNTTRTVVEAGQRRIQEMVSGYNASNPIVPLSISVGFAVRDNSVMSIDQLYGEADSNMYRYKITNSKNAHSAIVQNLIKQAIASDNSEQHERLYKLMELLKTFT